jgi:hypothetical protein
MAEAASARMSLEQWIVDKISIAARPKASVEKAHMLLAAALNALDAPSARKSSTIKRVTRCPEGALSVLLMKQTS